MFHEGTGILQKSQKDVENCSIANNQLILNRQNEILYQEYHS